MPSDIREIQRHAAILVAQVFTAFGHPHELLRRGFITRDLHTQIGDWVRHLEHFVRRIIFVLALAIDAPPPEPRTRPGSKSASTPRFTPPLRLRILGPTPSLIPGEASVHRSRPPFASLIDMLRITPRGVAVRSRSLARRLEALRHAICHADDRARYVARAIARRLMDPFRPTPKVRLRPWRVRHGYSTLASRLAAEYIVPLERLMPSHFADDG